MPTSDQVPISAGGTATVGNGDVVIVYGTTGATLKRLISGTVNVYIPVANPPTQDKKLSNIEVECAGTDGAAVDALMVTFGAASVFSQSGLNKTQDFTVRVTGASRQADMNPYGIDVTLTVNLPTKCATMEIQSVTLYFA